MNTNPGGDAATQPATEINVNTPAEVTTPDTSVDVNVNVGTEKPA